MRIAFVVSHPIQYYVPLYRRLAARSDVVVKVFFTLHRGAAPVYDRGFGQEIQWDIPLTSGYDHELVPNTARDPGSHHFFGLVNPSLARRVSQWQPDAVHVTGWASYSHLQALRKFHASGVRVLFRGDSHLLDGGCSGARWRVKRAVLNRVYSWPTAFLYVGQANRAYYEAFGVRADRLYRCPHSIDVSRFARQDDALRHEAAELRRQLGIGSADRVVVFAGKFEHKKRPVELMRAFLAYVDHDIILAMIGGGENEEEVKAIAAAEPARFRVLPFQNQMRMPVVYRLGDVFVLPSAFGETWGLAVNEAMACGVPVVVSSRVGCAADIVDTSSGRVFEWNDLAAMGRMINEILSDMSKVREMGHAARRRAMAFDTLDTENGLMDCLRAVLS